MQKIFKAKNMSFVTQIWEKGHGVFLGIIFQIPYSTLIFSVFVGQLKYLYYGFQPRNHRWVREQNMDWNVFYNPEMLFTILICNLNSFSLNMMFMQKGSFLKELKSYSIEDPKSYSFKKLKKSTIKKLKSSTIKELKKFSLKKL